MTKPTLPSSTKSKISRPIKNRGLSMPPRRRARRGFENSDVLVSAVISTHLLNHLHQVLQRAEYGAAKDGRETHAANFAQLRKVLCMDARSMKDASASGFREGEIDKISNSKMRSDAA